MFRFKQFVVDDRRSPMKVGTDGVLLGAWFEAREACRRILDVGAGCGVIALTAAQRTVQSPSRKPDRCAGTEPFIEAIDIDRGSVADAEENVRRSPWAERIAVRQISLKDYAAKAAGGKFDIILSNPPYYTNSQTPPDAGRAGARHTASLPPDQLAADVAALLAPDGAFSLILPPDEATKFIATTARHNLFPSKITEVYSNTNVPAPKRMLVEFRFRPQTPPTPRPASSRTTLAIHTPSGAFTEEYMALTREFYLKF
jgi:tRNA1Val (adenine37-N6)-methyltransferase